MFTKLNIFYIDTYKIIQFIFYTYVSKYYIVKVIIWDMETYKQIRRLEGHNHIVCSCAFSSDGALLVTASYDTRVIVWDPYTGRKLHILGLVLGVTFIQNFIDFFRFKSKHSIIILLNLNEK